MAGTSTHILLDTMVEHLKNELLTKMHADIAEALKERESTLRAMVHEMIAEQKAQMLKLLMEKVNEEVQHYSDSTDDAMSCFIGDMKSQFYDLMKVEIQREVSSQLQAKMADNKEEEKDGEKRATCVPTAGRIFFRRDIFKKYEEAEEQSMSLLGEEETEEQSMSLLAENVDGV